MESSPHKILLVGRHNTGKTVFGTQLLGRLRGPGPSLSLRYPPTSLSVLEDALDRLAEGRAPDHTPLDQFEQLLLPVAMPTGEKIDLSWPDYGGEQIDAILRERRVPSDWQARIAESDGWLLFLRLSLLRDYDDVVRSPLGELVRAREEAQHREVEWCDQAKLVELLQMFLFIRGASALRRLQRPALTIMLSCWDELDLAEATLPGDVLREQLPLLSSFLSAQWDEDAWSVAGLSAQGRPLSKDDPDADYVDQGPPNFGYVVGADGQQTADLTRPVTELIDRIR